MCRNVLVGSPLGFGMAVGSEAAVTGVPSAIPPSSAGSDRPPTEGGRRAINLAEIGPRAEGKEKGRRRKSEELQDRK